MTDDRWIYFETVPQDPRRKTASFRALSKDGDRLLGMVLWYAPWRCFAFCPAPGTVFERDCLRTIAEFCERATDVRREERKREREAEFTLARSHK